VTGFKEKSAEGGGNSILPLIAYSKTEGAHNRVPRRMSWASKRGDYIVCHHRRGRDFDEEEGDVEKLNCENKRWQARKKERIVSTEKKKKG